MLHIMDPGIISDDHSLSLGTDVVGLFGVYSPFLPTFPRYRKKKEIEQLSHLMSPHTLTLLTVIGGPYEHASLTHQRQNNY